MPNGKNKKVIGLIEDELGEKIIKEFVDLKVKTYSNLTDNNGKEKKAKGTKMCLKKNT